MEHPCSVPDEGGDSELDPRIQIELEKLNSATDEINKLEIELDEANTAFRMLLNESTRRLKLLSKKLGSCIERARPYYDSLEVAKKAQLECQRAAVQFQRANEIHQAAKETVALAEQRFLSKQHEWQFDNAWQEMLNHATIKVMDAENQKAESGREHQKRATLFNAAEQKVQQLEQRLRRSITKSRPYFEEKALCQNQLATQKERVETLQKAVAKVKAEYAGSLRRLERISEEIHYKRGKLIPHEDDDIEPRGPREPGVGAELRVYDELADYERELDRCDARSCGASSSGPVSELDESEIIDDEEEEDLETLKQKVRELAVRPVDGGGEGRSEEWEQELSATVDRLDKRLLRQESDLELAAVSTNRRKARSEPSLDKAAWSRPEQEMINKVDNNGSSDSSSSTSASPVPSTKSEEGSSSHRPMYVIKHVQANESIDFDERGSSSLERPLKTSRVD